MNILLLFFAIPLAIIILSIVLQKILKCPVLVAAVFFAIFLIIAFAVFDATFLVAVIIYTFLAYITAVIVKIICCLLRNCDWQCNHSCICGEDDCSCRRNTNTENNNVLTLSDGNDAFNRTNRNGCTCTISCRNVSSDAFNNGYNRGYNNGYDNGYNNAFDFWNDNENSGSGCSQNTLAANNNVAANSNRCGCNCRRRCCR